jgi:hypothetical protein
MTLDEFVSIIADCRADLDLMVRGHPFTQEEILEAMDAAEPDSAEMVALNIMLRNAHE